MSVSVKMGERWLDMNGPHLTELRSSNDIMEDATALRERMKEDGYLLIRGFHDRENVLAARRSLIEKLIQQGKLMPGTDPDEAMIGPDNKSSNFQGSHDQPQPFLDLVNSEHVMHFFDRFLGGESMNSVIMTATLYRMRRMRTLTRWTDQ